jgi:carbohydrate-selective porin OprB
MIKKNVPYNDFTFIAYYNKAKHTLKNTYYVRLFLNNRLFNKELPFKMGDYANYQDFYHYRCSMITF